ncbi:toll/interleukin-1 receptor domain-containing protein [Chlorobaculum limnaeum]|uniref:toll/interleukin-1 receptor domain-containing protein n=1 Tax=Chlorobaculum limnaeum TaxID=274537 RepID=UPI001471D0A9|nr:toll/interleukin-1 receptor domain-containing protein [Chlorobaculum limnaeum]
MFVSYSWSNSAERRALQAEIGELEGISVLVDKNYIKPGDQIHARVAQMIDAADYVVVLLTTEGLSSPEVRDELSRCHDRGKRIIPVAMEGTPLEDLPWFLRDVRVIKYNHRNFDAVVEELLALLHSLVDPKEQIDLTRLPPAIKCKLEKGCRLIVVGNESRESGLEGLLLFELHMRHSDAIFVIASDPKFSVELVAEYLAKDLQPHLRHRDYEWMLIKENRQLPGYLSLEAANLRSGDVVLLLGNHRMPEWAPFCR